MSFNFAVSTNAQFGAGKLNELHTMINAPMSAVQGKKALIVISNGKSTRANGYLERLEKELAQAGVEYVVFDKVSANPTKPIVEEGGKFAKENGCEFIVALGGGSVIDASKAIGLMATNASDDLWDYVLFGTGKKQFPPVPSLPIVAITTTAGTGSETDGGAVITNPDTKEKTGVFGVGTMPVLAIIDPELMTSVPAAFKAYQGFDALFHSTEGFISNKRNEMSKMVASEAIRNVSHNLVEAIANPENVEAMGKVAFGSYLSGIQMCVGSCTSAHPLEHALSVSHENLPHGAGLIMISKAYYGFFVNKHTCDDRFIEMAKLMGKQDADKPEDFLTVLSELQSACGVDNLKMSDYGITPEEFPGMVQNARDTLGANFLNDPVQLSDEDCLAIYQESYR
ncbi:iron-containing alcohol dehydrogenase [Enterocloster asparagiformis]|uniref:iron-containing alcohol dehydrogenase n=1 Tax=Enterocloster asparagiformis TaxID=333367 RepID=UPI0034C1894B